MNYYFAFYFFAISFPALFPDFKFCFKIDFFLQIFSNFKLKIFKFFFLNLIQLI